MANTDDDERTTNDVPTTTTGTPVKATSPTGVPWIPPAAVPWILLVLLVSEVSLYVLEEAYPNAKGIAVASKIVTLLGPILLGVSPGLRRAATQAASRFIGVVVFGLCCLLA
jgi:hypothetical protein